MLAVVVVLATCSGSAGTVTSPEGIEMTGSGGGGEVPTGPSPEPLAAGPSSEADPAPLAPLAPPMPPAPPAVVEPGARIVGTDARAGAPVAPDPEVEALLYEFGRLHLAYDHRADGVGRLEAIRALVTSELYTALSQPLPPALVELLEAEQRVVTAEPIGVQPLDTGTFLVSFTVLTSTGSVANGSRGVSEETRSLVITLDADLKVSDAR